VIGPQQRDAFRSECVEIRDLESFLLAEVPYGKIDPTHLRQGIVERVRPAGIGQRLQWQFGAEACDVGSAMRFEYQYTSSYGQPTLASLLIGFAAPGQARPHVANELLHHAENGGLERIAMSLEPDPANSKLNAFMTQSAPAGQPAFALPDAPMYVEFRGLARDYNSMNALPYTWSEVAADPAMLNQLLYWTFGGTSYRVCKAGRVYLHAGERPASLLIGYHGPGGN
jgi:hypothetical protein